jgi:hypothetical protein
MNDDDSMYMLSLLPMPGMGVVVMGVASCICGIVAVRIILTGARDKVEAESKYIYSVDQLSTFNFHFQP